MSGKKIDCPSCGGDNFWYTDHNSMGFCFNCSYKEINGSSRPPERHPDIAAIRDLYTRLTAYYHSCLTSAHETIMINRGITHDQIHDYKIGYVPRDRHVHYQSRLAEQSGIAISGKPFLGGRIVFPYWVNNEVTDIRGRTVEDHPLKYLSPRGSGYYRGADYPFNHAALQNDTVVITEGEIKALASGSIPAIGLPGMLSLRPQIRQRTDQVFIVCFDSQVDHWHDVVRAIHRVGKRFERVKVATLPLNGESKQDIDSFIVRYGFSAYARVIRRAIWYTEWKQLVKL